MIARKTVMGFLVFSAVFLSGLLVFVNTRESGMAYGKTYGVQAGNYTVTIAQVEGRSDALWILKTDEHFLMVCEASSKGRMNILGMVDLQEIFSRAIEEQPRETPAAEGGIVPRRRR